MSDQQSRTCRTKMASSKSTSAHTSGASCVLIRPASTPLRFAHLHASTLNTAAHLSCACCQQPQPLAHHSHPRGAVLAVLPSGHIILLAIMSSSCSARHTHSSTARNTAPSHAGTQQRAPLLALVLLRSIVQVHGQEAVALLGGQLRRRGARQVRGRQQPPRARLRPPAALSARGSSLHGPAASAFVSHGLQHYVRQ